MVPRAGLEPARDCSHKILSLASLPISSPRHFLNFYCALGIRLNAHPVQENISGLLTRFDTFLAFAANSVFFNFFEMAQEFKGLQIFSARAASWHSGCSCDGCTNFFIGEISMKKHMLFLSLVLLSAQALAQVESQNIDVDVDSELDQMYQQQPRSSVTQNKKSSRNANVVNQTVVVPQTSVQTQPTTFIEASPLSDSKADYIRKNRQDEEMKTETRIVEKLEQSRMEDEKRRAAALFGDKFDNMQNHSPAQPAVQMAPAAQPVQSIIIEERETLSRDAVREEVRMALQDDSSAIVAPTESRYFAGLAGIGFYPDVTNVKGNYSLGAAFGTRYDFFLVEGAFLMSNYGVDVKNNGFFNGGFYRLDNYDVNQYQGSIAAKYQLLSGMVRPVLGGLVAYSYRKYALTNNYSGSSEDTGNSHAIDLGINAGVDVEFSPNFALGFDFKYMFNMSSRVNSNYPNSSYGYVGTPLEKLQYSITSIVARVNF